MKTKSFKKKNNFDIQIKDILDNFNFGQVLDYMSQFCYHNYDDEGNLISKSQWRMFTNGKYKLPTESELKDLAKELLEDVSKRTETYNYIHTGPFRAVLAYGHLELLAVFEHWHYED